MLLKTHESNGVLLTEVISIKIIDTTVFFRGANGCIYPKWYEPHDFIREVPAEIYEGKPVISVGLDVFRYNESEFTSERTKAYYYNLTGRSVPSWDTVIKA